MRQWTKRLFAVVAPLLLAGCLWGPGRFNSDLTLRKDGRFILDYRGEMILQIPSDASTPAPWKDSMAKCQEDGKDRPCSASEIASQKSEFEKSAATKRQEAEQMAKIFGLPGLDDESNRAFAAKLSKYAGWRSVTYRGNGVFDVDYHFEGRATQDFLFPALPDNDLIIPFIAIRRRTDGAVLVTAPAMTGASGPLGIRAGAPADSAREGMPTSRAQGRFTVTTDGEILTNNSEDGAASNANGRQVHWDIGSASKKIPETLIRL